MCIFRVNWKSQAASVSRVIYLVWHYYQLISWVLVCSLGSARMVGFLLMLVMLFWWQIIVCLCVLYEIFTAKNVLDSSQSTDLTFLITVTVLMVFALLMVQMSWHKVWVLWHQSLSFNICHLKLRSRTNTECLFSVWRKTQSTQVNTDIITHLIYVCRMLEKLPFDLFLLCTTDRIICRLTDLTMFLKILPH